MQGKANAGSLNPRSHQPSPDILPTMLPDTTLRVIYTRPREFVVLPDAAQGSRDSGLHGLAGVEEGQGSTKPAVQYPQGADEI